MTLFELCKKNPSPVSIVAKKKSNNGNYMQSQQDTPSVRMIFVFCYTIPGTYYKTKGRCNWCTASFVTWSYHWLHQFLHFVGHWSCHQSLELGVLKNRAPVQTRKTDQLLRHRHKNLCVPPPALERWLAFFSFGSLHLSFPQSAITLDCRHLRKWLLW